MLELKTEIYGDINEDDSKIKSNLSATKMEHFCLSNDRHRKELECLLAALNMRLIFCTQTDFRFDEF